MIDKIKNTLKIPFIVYYEICTQLSNNTKFKKVVAKHPICRNTFHLNCQRGLLVEALIETVISHDNYGSPQTESYVFCCTGLCLIGFCRCLHLLDTHSSDLSLH